MVKSSLVITFFFFDDAKIIITFVFAKKNKKWSSIMLQHLKPLVKDSAIYALGNMSGKVVGLVLLPLYLKNFSIAEYGMLGALDATFQLIVAVVGLNLTGAFARWYWDEEISDRQKSTYFTTLTFVTLMALFVFACFYPMSRTVSTLLFDTGDYTRLIRLMTLSAALELIGNIPAVLSKMQRKAALYSRNLIIRLAVVLASTVVAIVFFNRNIEGVYEAQVIGSIVYLILFLPLTLKNISAKFEVAILVKMLNYSLPLVLSSSFGTILVIADRLTLNFISGSESVGIYSLGHKLANTLKIVIVFSVQATLVPIIFQMVNKPDVKQFISKTFTYFTFGLMVFVIGLSMFGQEIVKFLANDPEYWDAYHIIPFIAFGIVFSMMKDNASYGLQIVKRSGIIASITIFISILNVFLNILFINAVGTIGAGLSTLLSQIVFFFVMLYFASRHYPVSYEFRKVFLSIGAGALICVATFFISDWSLFWRLLIKTALLACYPLILYSLGCFDKNELQALQGFWKKWRKPSTNQ